MLQSRRPSPDCFDIAQELLYWRGCFHHRDIASLRLGESALSSAFRFAYDSYILHGKYAFPLAVCAIEERYGRDALRHRVTWNQVLSISRMVWARLHHEIDSTMQVTVDTV